MSSTPSAGAASAADSVPPVPRPARGWLHRLRRSGLQASVLPWASLAARIVVAFVFGWAAIAKIADPAGSVRAVRAYRILPEALVHPVAYALPSFELALAVLLLVGLATRWVGALAALSLAGFIGAVASAGLRGLRIDCGCFGGGGTVVHTHYLLDIGRDSLLLLLALLIPLARTSRWSVDALVVSSSASREVASPSRPPRGTSSAKANARRARLAAEREAELRRNRRRRQWSTVGIAGLIMVSTVAIGIGASSAHVSATNQQVVVAPAGATDAGGIVVGSSSAPVKLVIYEDPQCPVCSDFERIAGPTLQSAVAAGKVSVEYRMRSFLGPESVRAVNALAAAAQAGKFEALREAVYAHQPKEHTGGYTTDELLALSANVGLKSAAYADAVRSMAYAPWVAKVDDRASRDGNVGTPEVIRVGSGPLPQQVLFDPAQFAAAIGAT